MNSSIDQVQKTKLGFLEQYILDTMGNANEPNHEAAIATGASPELAVRRPSNVVVAAMCVCVCVCVCVCMCVCVYNSVTLKT